MRYRQVEAFRAAMISGSVTGAATLLSIAQPSASRLIADLEEGVGFRLFLRNGGRLTPTTEGLRFYTAVERSFVGMEKLERVAEQIRQARTGHLTVCALPVLAAAVMPGAIKRFLDGNPDVTVNLEVLYPTEILESLQAQQADVAMSVEFADVPGVRRETLIDVRFVAVLPEGHPLCARETVSVADFEGQDYVGVLPSTPIDWSRIDRVFEERGVRPHRRVATTHSNAAYGMVAAGLGIGLFEPFAAGLWAGNGVVVKPVDAELVYSYALCMPDARADSPLVQAFVAALRDHLRDNPPAFNAAAAESRRANP